MERPDSPRRVDPAAEGTWEPPPQKRSDSRGPHRVLVIRLSAIGDVLHAMPAVFALKEARPSLEIDWLVEDRAAAVLRGFRAVDRVHEVPRRRWSEALARVAAWPRLAMEASRLLMTLLSRRYDATVDLQGNLKSGLWAFASGAPARLGFSTEETREANGFFTNRHVGVDRRVRHRVERSLALASTLVNEPLAYAGTGIASTESGGFGEDAVRWARDAVIERLAGATSRYVVLHPSTSGFGAFKRWPAERFARLAERIRETSSTPVLVTGAPGEESLVNDVCARATPPLPSLVTPSLPSLAEVVRGACAFVSADTGPLHLAAAVGTPVVGLFGPKDDQTYGPFGWREDGTPGLLRTLTRDDVPCRPCAVRWCPEPVCMSAIDEEDVLEAIRPHLQPRG